MLLHTSMDIKGISTFTKIETNFVSTILPRFKVSRITFTINLMLRSGQHAISPYNINI